MSSETKSNKLPFMLIRLVVLVALMVAAIASGRFADFIDAFCLGFVLIGAFALALMSFSVDDIVTACKGAGGILQSAAERQRSHFFWESLARSFWMVGVLTTLIAFAVALTGPSREIKDITMKMAGSLVSSVYGLIFFVTCLVVAMKLNAGSPDSLQAPRQESPGTFRSIGWSNAVGYLLFIAMIVGALARAAITGDVETNVAGYHAWEWLIYWPSLLVVLGGTAALVLYIGSAAKGQAFTFGFAVTGFIGSLMGFIQVLLGMAARSIQEISTGITLILSSCFFALLGMILVGAPLEDLAVKNSQSGRRSTMSRVAWYVFPLVAMIFVVIALVIVITPMQKPA